MPTVTTGIVHGRSIELSHDVGLPDGQTVRVTIDLAPQVPLATGSDARNALMRAAGSWSDDADGLESYLNWNRQQRKTTRREISA